MNERTLVIGNRNYSSWSLRAWIALRQSGLAFDEIRLSLDTPEFHRQVSRYSPTGRVPVLIDGDTVVWDSLAIGEYVAELCPEATLWPSDPKLRATARSMCAEMHSGFAAVRSSLPMNCRARGRRVDITAGIEDEIRRITRLWQNCLGQSGAEGPWLFGHFTIADAMFAPVASRFVTYGIVLDDLAGEYVRELMDSAAMREWCEAAAREPEVLPSEELGQQGVS